MRIPELPNQPANVRVRVCQVTYCPELGKPKEISFPLVGPGPNSAFLDCDVACGTCANVMKKSFVVRSGR